MAAVLVFLVGVGVGCLGLLVNDLYVVGLVIMLIGLVGVATRLVDRLIERMHERHG
jgi:hypothetical protein